MIRAFDDGESVGWTSVVTGVVDVVVAAIISHGGEISSPFP